MNRPLYQKYVLMALISLMAASVYFVTVTSAGLPPTVASHFNAAGVANGFMSKNNYTFSMLVISVVQVKLNSFEVGSGVLLGAE